MDSFVIEGGNQLKGEVKIAGAKNVVLKCLIASLLTNEEVVVTNVPLISDLYLLAEMIRGLGVKVDIGNDHIMVVNAKNFFPGPIPSQSCKKLRASFLLAAPLLCRFREAKIPFPGGDNIGIRPIDRTIDGLKSLGASIKFHEDRYIIKGNKLQGNKYRFEKNTHTGTECLIMAGALASGETILENAAQEPEIDELIRMLNLMGARIKRTDERKIVIRGVNKLRGIEFKIIPDRNEVVTFAISALLTKGRLEIFPVLHSHLNSFYSVFKKTGATFQIQKQKLIVDGTNKTLTATQIQTSPHPGFMSDWQAPWTLLMTQAEGTSVIWEKVFENRFGYVTELKKMGAMIELFNPKVRNPHQVYNFNWKKNSSLFSAAKIVGPQRLHGENLLIPDLRAGATLVLAALAAEGQSSISGVHHIDRGYENFDMRLNSLGAKIVRSKT